MGDDVGEQAGEGVAGAAGGTSATVWAAGVSLQVSADQAQHGGEAEILPRLWK